MPAPSRRLGLAGLTVFGCFLTMATQLVLMNRNHVKWTYVLTWYLGKLFGFLSTFAARWV